jgi:hypothetical protein
LAGALYASISVIWADVQLLIRFLLPTDSAQSKFAKWIRRNEMNYRQAAGT